MTSDEETKEFAERLSAKIAEISGDSANEGKQKMVEEATKLQSLGAYTKMPSYIGTKVVCAWPMNEIEFLIKYKDANPDVMKREDMAGYLVEYEDGYKSWSPKDVFERSYRRITDAERRII